MGLHSELRGVKTVLMLPALTEELPERDRYRLRAETPRDSLSKGELHTTHPLRGMSCFHLDVSPEKVAALGYDVV